MIEVVGEVQNRLRELELENVRLTWELAIARGEVTQ